jgi:hypothetical protein
VGSVLIGVGPVQPEIHNTIRTDPAASIQARSLKLIVFPVAGNEKGRLHSICPIVP